MRIFKETPNFPFVKNTKFLVLFSVMTVLISFYFIATRGLNYGTDFLGGVNLQYQLPREVQEGEIRNQLAQLHLENFSVIRLGHANERRIIIKTSQHEETSESLSKIITPVLAKIYGEAGLVLEKEEAVGAKVGAELRKKAVLAVLFSLLCMLIYVGFRFDFQFAPGAIISLFHDVFIVLGFFAYFQLEFDLTVLAACLTVVGYSINDTIIVFDRVREHTRLITPETINDIVNQSLNETLSRTLITSLTVFFVLVVIYFLGGATIKNFSFAMLIGVVTGTYSTFSVSCPCYVGMYRLTPKLQSLSRKN